MSSEWDSNVFPLAYLITFRTYGTWLHGVEKGSVDRKHNIYGTPRLAPNPHRKNTETRLLKHAPTVLDARQRRTVDRAVREVCAHRGYALLAVNVRTNHVHTVLSAARDPEPILDALKAYATRALRRAALASPTTKLWVRHGSTRYLWKEQHVEKAIAYVLYGQGDDPPEFN
jgi:REP element-mobilizing transposase RayT